MPQQHTILGHHADVEPGDEHDHSLALVGVPHADVMKPRPVTKRHLAVLVDAVTANPDPRSDADLRSRWPRLVSGLEGSARRDATSRPVRPDAVVVGAEP